ncbi:MAG TPA: DUF4126 domain-containing protein [Herpetosiphonaceae bacterium]
MVWMSVIALVLIIVAGLNAPLAICALSIASLNGIVILQPPLAWIGTEWAFLLALTLLVIQLLADLYFVPITVKDRVYLHPSRTENAYLHARVQSFFRPLIAAIITAALPLPLPDWLAAIFGFSSASACYWLSAWIREYVAIARGALILLSLETLKNALLIVVGLLAFWLPPLALVLLIGLLFPTVVWTMRLQREQMLYAPYGGQSAGEDT